MDVSLLLQAGILLGMIGILAAQAPKLQQKLIPIKKDQKKHKS